MKFIGIDLSWKVSPEKPERTAAVVLNEEGMVENNTLITTNEDIVDFVKNYIDYGTIIGVDAPLVIPFGVKQRDCERLLLRCKIAVFPGNRRWFISAFGGVRGEILVNEFKKINVLLKDNIRPKEEANTLFEVYPYSSWKVLFKKEAVPKYKNTTRSKKIEGLNRLKGKLMESILPIKLSFKRDIPQLFDVDRTELSNKALDQQGDLLDALIAAYTVLVYWHYGDRKCVVLGDLKEGFILTLANDCMKKLAKKGKY
ncbi:MAG: DUF429 domain-containing protein [Thermoplasmata archaeon]|nr:MAG: DUF429 domain-containing protein [Thermoplasmata archaeon]